jgi:hypothetical protein
VGGTYITEEENGECIRNVNGKSCGGQLGDLDAAGKILLKLNSKGF